MKRRRSGFFRKLTANGQILESGGKARHLFAARDGMDAPQKQSSDDDFVELMTKNQLRLRSFILTLVRDAATADDVLQDTSLVVWKKRLDFDRSKDFFRWACGVALLEVLQYRRRADSDRLLFDEDLINVLAVDYMEHVEDWDQQRSALRGCIQKLPCWPRNGWNLTRAAATPYLKEKPLSVPMCSLRR